MAYPVVPMLNKKFGMLTVISASTPIGYWKCQCDCGTRVVIRGASLRSGNTKSCGCMRNHKGSKRGPMKVMGKPKPIISIGQLESQALEVSMRYAAKQLAKGEAVALNPLGLLYKAMQDHGVVFIPNKQSGLHEQDPRRHEFSYSLTIRNKISIYGPFKSYIAAMGHAMQYAIGFIEEVEHTKSGKRRRYIKPVPLTEAQLEHERLVRSMIARVPAAQGATPGFDPELVKKYKPGN